MTRTTLHPTLARNAPNEGLTAADGSSVAITNAIVVSHSVGIRALDGVTVTVDGVLWYGNARGHTAGVVQVSHAYTAAPGFTADGHHLTAGSAAIDRGVAAGVADDIDGQPRDAQPDLGADEYRPAVVRIPLYLPLVLK